MPNHNGRPTLLFALEFRGFPSDSKNTSKIRINISNIKPICFFFSNKISAHVLSK